MICLMEICIVVGCFCCINLFVCVVVDIVSMLLLLYFMRKSNCEIYGICLKYNKES